MWITRLMQITKVVYCKQTENLMAFSAKCELIYRQVKVHIGPLSRDIKLGMLGEEYIFNSVYNVVLRLKSIALML